SLRARHFSLTAFRTLSGKAPAAATRETGAWPDSREGDIQRGDALARLAHSETRAMECESFAGGPRTIAQTECPPSSVSGSGWRTARVQAGRRLLVFTNDAAQAVYERRGPSR